MNMNNNFMIDTNNRMQHHRSSSRKKPSPKAAAKLAAREVERRSSGEQFRKEASLFASAQASSREDVKHTENLPKTEQSKGKPQVVKHERFITKTMKKLKANLQNRLNGVGQAVHEKACESVKTVQAALPKVRQNGSKIAVGVTTAAVFPYKAAGNLVFTGAKKAASLIYQGSSTAVHEVLGKATSGVSTIAPFISSACLVGEGVSLIMEGNAQIEAARSTREEIIGYRVTQESRITKARVEQDPRATHTPITRTYIEIDADLEAKGRLKRNIGGGCIAAGGLQAVSVANSIFSCISKPIFCEGSWLAGAANYAGAAASTLVSGAGKAIQFVATPVVGAASVVAVAGATMYGGAKLVKEGYQTSNYTKMAVGVAGVAGGALLGAASVAAVL